MSDPLPRPMLDGATVGRLDGWSGLTVRGADAESFLQGFCTADVGRLAVGDACEAFFTDVKAHILAYALVTRDAAGFVVLLSSGGAEDLRSHLDRYLIREAAELELLPDAFGYALAGAGLAGVELPAGVAAAAVAAWGDGVRLLFGEAEAISRWAPDATRLTDQGVERTRIERGVPRDRLDVDQRNLPQEVDRVERTISFTKGCYLGQEPVARIDALGRVNWRLRGLRIDGTPPAAGAELTLPDDPAKPVGRITSAVAAGEGVSHAAIALAYVRREHAAAGVRLAVGDATAEVADFPLRG